MAATTMEEASKASCPEKDPWLQAEVKYARLGVVILEEVVYSIIVMTSVHLAHQFGVVDLMKKLG